jgi:hypothetical protein
MPAIVSATSFVPEEITGEKPQAMVKVGTTVYMFHSGNGAQKNVVAVNDILTVYHEEPCRTVSEVGKIKIVSFYGDNYLKAEVIEGEIKNGDMAKKGRISYLISPTAFVCK